MSANRSILSLDYFYFVALRHIILTKVQLTHTVIVPVLFMILTLYSPRSSSHTLSLFLFCLSFSHFTHQGPAHTQCPCSCSVYHSHTLLTKVQLTHCPCSCSVYHSLTLRPVYMFRHRPRHSARQSLTSCLWLMGRMGLEPILPVRRPVTIDTMLNFGGHCDGAGTCKQAFIHQHPAHTHCPCSCSVYDSLPLLTKVQLTHTVLVPVLFMILSHFTHQGPAHTVLVPVLFMILSHFAHQGPAHTHCPCSCPVYDSHTLLTKVHLTHTVLVPVLFMIPTLYSPRSSSHTPSLFLFCL